MPAPKMNVSSRPKRFRPAILIGLLFAVLLPRLAWLAHAEDFSVREVGLAFTTPAGWHYQS